MKLKKIIPLVAVTIMGICSISYAFSDMPVNHWAYKTVKLMQEKQIISGFDDGTFRPDELVTREQFATILSKTLDINKNNEVIYYKDVSEDRWSKQYIDAVGIYMYDASITGNYHFSPENPAIREEMAVAVVKAKGLQNQVADYTVLDKFKDKDEIAENYKHYVAIAVENGIMSGNANGTFNPKGNLTRAEIAALMSNVSELVVDIEKELEDKEIKEVVDNFYANKGEIIRRDYIVKRISLQSIEDNFYIYETSVTYEKDEVIYNFEEEIVIYRNQDNKLVVSSHDVIN